MNCVHQSQRPTHYLQNLHVSGECEKETRDKEHCEKDRVNARVFTHAEQSTAVVTHEFNFYPFYPLSLLTLSHSPYFHQ